MFLLKGLRIEGEPTTHEGQGQAAALQMLDVRDYFRPKDLAPRTWVVVDATDGVVTPGTTDRARYRPSVLPTERATDSAACHWRLERVDEGEGSCQRP